MPAWLTVDGDDCLIDVWVVPASSRQGVVGGHGDRLRVRVAAPPEGGRANRAVVALIGDLVQAPASLERGARSRAKQVRVSGVSAAALEAALPP
jgi:uncharacterized protein